MNIKFLSLILILLPFFCWGAGEQLGDKSQANKDWLKIFYHENERNKLEALPISEIDSIQYSDTKGSDGTIEETNMFVSSNGKVFKLNVDSLDAVTLGTNIPSLYIDTDPYVDEITSKEEYLKANIRYIPYDGLTDTLENTVSIRGRGNSTWLQPKKPYRLKFDKKQSLGGLRKAKNFVLLANYLDNTLMRNAIAFKAAELLEMPYTNSSVPVNLYFNGQYRGNYVMTEKVGINSGSVDIDEETGIMWELDVSFDEEFKFKDPIYQLPAMVKDPDFNDIKDKDEREATWQMWQEDLTNALTLVKEGNWTEAFDEEQLVKFMFVSTLVLNGDLMHPKSTYLYKENKDEKYKFGPVWDFDLAFDNVLEIDDCVYTRWDGHFFAYDFVKPILLDERFKIRFKEVMDDFLENKLDSLLDFIDSYAANIETSSLQDATRWPESNISVRDGNRSAYNFKDNVENLKNWILQRIEIVRNDENFKLIK